MTYNTGYKGIVLYDKNGKKNPFLIHRLVALVFLPNPEHKEQVDHINTVITDNRVDNLRWATAKENSNNPISLRRSTSANKEHAKYGRENIFSKPLYQYDKDKNLIASYVSSREASESTGIKIRQIQHAVLGEQKMAGGYYWYHSKL